MAPPSLAAESRRAESAAILLVRLSDEAFLPANLCRFLCPIRSPGTKLPPTLAFSLISLFNHVYILPKPYVFG